MGPAAGRGTRADRVGRVLRGHHRAHPAARATRPRDGNGRRPGQRPGGRRPAPAGRDLPRPGRGHQSALLGRAGAVALPRSARAD